jgi:hypothetical protein
MKSEFYEDVREYLHRRVSDSTTYRGMHLVQHQRLPEDKLFVILKSIHDAVGESSFVEPANDDPSPTGKSHQLGDPRRTPRGNTAEECIAYWDILDNIAAANVDDVGATFNSLKKNTFPNLEGMKLLIRTPGLTKNHPKKAQLSPIAVKFIFSQPRERTRIFSECNENVLKPMINVLDITLQKFDTVSVYEMMLFLTDENLSTQNRIELLGKYKRLKTLQIIQLHKDLQSYMANKMGPNVAKVDKLDWHNWWNESKQITQMLNTVIGFNVYQNELIMKAGNAEATSFTANRLASVKKEALIWHSVEPRENWDLHHILPVEYATGSADLRHIDDKRNLLYIPSSIHRKIPNTSNLMVEFTFDALNVYLQNPLVEGKEPRLAIAWPRDAAVNKLNLDSMVDYNKKLLELVIA